VQAPPSEPAPTGKYCPSHSHRQSAEARFPKNRYHSWRASFPATSTRPPFALCGIQVPPLQKFPGFFRGISVARENRVGLREFAGSSRREISQAGRDALVCAVFSF